MAPAPDAGRREVRRVPRRRIKPKRARRGRSAQTDAPAPRPRLEVEQPKRKTTGGKRQGGQRSSSALRPPLRDRNATPGRGEESLSDESLSDELRTEAERGRELRRRRRKGGKR
jgi:hypothetical protein